MFKGTEKHHIRYRKKKISCDDLKIGIGKPESEGIVLNVFKDLKGTLARMTTPMRSTAENRKWGKNKSEFGGVRMGRRKRAHRVGFTPGKTHGGESSATRNQKSRCPLRGWDSPRERVRRGVGKLPFGPAVVGMTRVELGNARWRGAEGRV